MKKGILAGCLLVAMAACNTPEKMLCRKWTLTDVDFNEKELGYTAEQKPEMVKQMRDSCLFNFKKDHTYSARLIAGTDTGRWRFSKNGDTLYTQTGLVSSFSKINTLNKNTLDIMAYPGNSSPIKLVLTSADGSKQ